MVFDADTCASSRPTRRRGTTCASGPGPCRNRSRRIYSPPEDRQAFHSLLTLLRNGRQRRTPFSARCRRGGSRYPVEAPILYWHDREQPVFVWMANDASRREGTRQALEHSVSDLHAIVAHIPGTAFQIVRRPDARPVLHDVSEQPAQLLGIKASALSASPSGSSG